MLCEAKSKDKTCRYTQLTFKSAILFYDPSDLSERYWEAGSWPSQLMKNITGIYLQARIKYAWLDQQWLRDCQMAIISMCSKSLLKNWVSWLNDNSNWPVSISCDELYHLTLLNPWSPKHFNHSWMTQNQIKIALLRNNSQLTAFLPPKYHKEEP